MWYYIKRNRIEILVWTLLALALSFVLVLAAHSQPLTQDYCISPMNVYTRVANNWKWNITVRPRYSPDSTRVLWKAGNGGQFSKAQKTLLLQQLDVELYTTANIDSALTAKGWNAGGGE